MIAALLQRLRRFGARDTLTYTLGRFQVVRRVRKWMRRLSAQQPRAAAPASVRAFDPDAALASLSADSVFEGLALEPAVLESLLAAVRSSEPRIADGGGGGPATPPLLRERSASGSPVLITRYLSPEIDRSCAQIANDPALIKVVVGFLGAFPRDIEIRLQESLVADASVDYRESRSQTVMFHYDVHGFDFLYAFFYLTDCDAASGAHEMIAGSHKGKTLRQLLGTARQTDAEIYSHFGRSRARVIEGKSGSGFFEDTSCFHRALAPVERPRLALQIRYSS